jgi:hypothetical protein
MSIFTDDFSTNTLDEYEFVRGRQFVSWDSRGEQLLVRAGNNDAVLMSRDEFQFPEAGTVRLRLVVQNDYHVTNRIRVGWVEDDEDVLQWQASGSAPDSSPWADNYDDWVRTREDGEWTVHDRSSGTVGPSSEERLIEASWTPSSMSITVDGDLQASAEIDTTSFDPVRFRLYFRQGDIDLKSIDICDDSSNEIAASLTTLQFIPGKEENPSRDGYPLDSGLMEVIPEDAPLWWGAYGVAAEAVGEPVFDSWMGGDMRDELPVNLDDARKPKQNKYFDDAPREAFNEYRFENSVAVSFETTGDGEIDENSLDIEFSEAGPTGNDTTISRGDREPSRTILHDHELNGIPWREWYGGNVRRSNREPRYFEYYPEFTFDGEDGVRVVTVWGGWAGFMENVAYRSSADPASFLATIWDWDSGFREWILRRLVSSAPEEIHYILETLTTVPRNFTFLDFIVLADGRRYAKIWDSSPYPSQYTYLDGKLREEYNMWYLPEQAFNPAMLLFHQRAIVGVTPHSNKSIEQYMEFLRTQVKLVDEDEELPDDFRIDPWSERFDDSLKKALTAFGLEGERWELDNLVPVYPRTLGVHANGEPVEDPNEPFPPVDDLSFPGTNELPPS